MKWVKFRVSGHFPENAWRKWPEILHAGVSWSPSELISLWLPSVDFSNFGSILKWVKFGVSRHCQWPEILHADVSWPPSELISLWPWSVDFAKIWHYFDLVRQVKFGVSGHFLGNACMLMYPYHLQNWLVLGHGLLTFVILALFWLSETGQIWGFWAFPGERMDEMAWNMVCCCILTTFRTWLDYGCSLVIFSCDQAA